MRSASSARARARARKCTRALVASAAAASVNVASEQHVSVQTGAQYFCVAVTFIKTAPSSSVATAAVVATVAAAVVATVAAAVVATPPLSSSSFAHIDKTLVFARARAHMQKANAFERRFRGRKQVCASSLRGWLRRRMRAGGATHTREDVGARVQSRMGTHYSSEQQRRFCRRHRRRRHCRRHRLRRHRRHRQ